ncbi:MAG: Fe-S cluster assembly protein SufD [candidate division NC10 bacterium]|nr:Fe-S cluster assembly protein SufD [candidate division NC10 bacterium]
MIQHSKELDRYLADFERFEKNGLRGGPSWVHQVRRAAISGFAELGFPTTQHEEWKYTSVAPIVKAPFRPADDEPDGLTKESLSLHTLGQAACAQLVFVNGRYSPALSSIGSLPDGVKAGSLATALSADPAAVEPHLARHAGYHDHPFVALNTAFIQDGAFVSIPKGKVVERPIHLLFVSTHDRPASTGLSAGFDMAQDRRGKAIVSHPRNLILAGDNSQAMVIESYIGLNNALYFTNVVTEIVAGESAVVAHYKLQRESEEAFHISTVQASLNHSSNFSSHSIDLGGALVRNDVNAVLDGQGIECTLDGLYMVAGRQHVDNHTRIDHVKPHCSSRELYKGVLGGRSKGVFNGKIYVHKDAQKTDAKQTNKNLLLSEDAVINTKPQLEIYADDVKCTHGTTIGQLDQEAIFYLRSRGIDLEAARGLLTYAFASEMIGRIKVEPVRAQLEHLLLARLQKDS